MNHIKKEQKSGNKIKEAFNKVKQDMNILRDELNNLREELKENRELMIKICGNVQEMFSQIDSAHSQTKLISKEEIPAHLQITPTYKEKIPAHFTNFKHLNNQKSTISTGNKGVPADRQTDQQTDRQVENSIESAAEMLKSLDNLKKEIYTKFKKLTEQEWLVFSNIYQFDEERGYSDYRILAEKLNLTESSIRDYVSKLINKGIPIDKTKLNNKNIRLNISQSFKQIASLSTMIYLREL